MNDLTKGELFYFTKMAFITFSAKLRADSLMSKSEGKALKTSLKEKH